MLFLPAEGPEVRINRVGVELRRASIEVEYCHAATLHDELVRYHQALVDVQRDHETALVDEQRWYEDTLLYYKEIADARVARLRAEGN